MMLSHLVKKKGHNFAGNIRQIDRKGMKKLVKNRDDEPEALKNAE